MKVDNYEDDYENENDGLLFDMDDINPPPPIYEIKADIDSFDESLPELGIILIGPKARIMIIILILMLMILL